MIHLMIPYDQSCVEVSYTIVTSQMNPHMIWIDWHGHGVKTLAESVYQNFKIDALSWA